MTELFQSAHEMNGDPTVLSLSVRLLGFPFSLRVFPPGMSLAKQGAFRVNVAIGLVSANL